MPEDQEKAYNWDLYWAHGFLTSCANAFPGNYEGRIRELWEDFFARLPAGARILDVATGNGAIALLAAEYSLANDARFETHGIDSARIDPASAWTGEPEVLAAVNFHGQTSAEQTGFPDGHFQAVTGQYALEYTDIGPTLAELARVMAPGASGRFLLHHPDSIVIQTSVRERAHGQLLFEEALLFDKAERLLQCIIAAEERGEKSLLADDADAQAARASLNEAAAAVSAAIQASDVPDLLSAALGHVRTAFETRASQGAEPTLARLARGRAEIQGNLARLDDLLSAVVSPDKMAGIQSLMSGLGLQPGAQEKVTYPYQGHEFLMGWVLDFERPE